MKSIVHPSISLVRYLKPKYVIASCHSTLQPSNSSSCKRHYERKMLMFSCEQCYDVVSDVDRYKEFVPWVKSSKIIQSNENHDKDQKFRNIDAELVVGFGIFTESYISSVRLFPNHAVKAVSRDSNLFQTLNTEWKFSPASNPKHCWVTFQIDFQFKSSLYNIVSEKFLDEVVKKMVEAFQLQCERRYPNI